MWVSHALINHLLLQQPELKTALARHTGRLFRLTALGVSTDMAIRDDGYVAALPEGQTSECHITIQASTWQKILQGDAFGVGDVSITGDSDLAMAVLPILGQLRYQPYADASRLFGNTAASFMEHQFQQLKTTANQMVSSVEGEIRDFVQEANAPLVSQSEWHTQSAAIDTLRDDVARLAARLQRLSSFTGR